MTKNSVRSISITVFFGLFFFSAIVNTATATTWEKLVDYGMEGYSETSQNWDTYSSPESVNGSYRYLSRLEGDGTRTGTATWQTEVPFCGVYSVRVSCRKTENRTTDADYFVTNSSGGVDHYVINQVDHRNILDWDSLGFYEYEAGQNVAVFLDGTDDYGSDCADATLWKLEELRTCPIKALTLQTTITDGSKYAAVGNTVSYNYLVTSSGNTPVTGPITVIDNKTTVSCPEVTTTGNEDANLDPNEAILCTSTYTIAQDDFNAGTVTNTAYAKADDGTISNYDSATATKRPVTIAPPVSILLK